MGWLHTGRKRHEEGYYGQSSSAGLSAQIYERNQRATWENGVRLPFHRLYGPAVSDLVQSPEVTKAIDRFLQSSTLPEEIWASIYESRKY